MKAANKTSERVFRYLLNLNFWIVMALGILIARSMTGYIREGSAHEFLKGVEAIPETPNKISVAVFLFYLVLLLLFQIREEGELLFFLKTGMEIFAGLSICYLLNFSYSGILLLVLADVAKNLADARWKFGLIGLIGIFYLFADYYLVPDIFKTASLEMCLSYYRGDVRVLLPGMRRLMFVNKTMLDQEGIAMPGED